MPGEENKSGPASSSSSSSSASAPPLPEFATPKYKVIHRKNADIKDFAHLVSATDATRPDELVVEIEVPLVKSANDIDVDVLRNKLLLKTDPKGVGRGLKRECDVPRAWAMGRRTVLSLCLRLWLLWLAVD